MRDTVDEALNELRGGDGDAAQERIERELAGVKREHTRLMTAIGSGEQIAGLLEALRALDRRRKDLWRRGVPRWSFRRA